MRKRYSYAIDSLSLYTIHVCTFSCPVSGIRYCESKLRRVVATNETLVSFDFRSSFQFWWACSFSLFGWIWWDWSSKGDARLWVMFVGREHTSWEPNLFVLPSHTRAICCLLPKLLSASRLRWTQGVRHRMSICELGFEPVWND